MRACALNPPPPSLGGEQCVLDTARSFCQTPSSNAQYFLPNSIFTSFTRISNILPPAPLLIPPGRPKVARWSAQGRRNAVFMQFWADFFSTPKLIKNRHPPKASQNRKNPILERQSLHFDVILGAILAYIFEGFSILLRKRRKTRRRCNSQLKLMKFHDLACPKPHISSSNFNEISMFFQDPLLDIIFLDFLASCCDNA